MKILSIHGNIYKTFGENIILLLNREGRDLIYHMTINNILTVLFRRNIFATTYAQTTLPPLYNSVYI
jgi:Protein of unknown function (DUF2013)